MREPLLPSTLNDHTASAEVLFFVSLASTSRCVGLGSACPPWPEPPVSFPALALPPLLPLTPGPCPPRAVWPPDGSSAPPLPPLPPLGDGPLLVELPQPAASMSAPTATPRTALSSIMLGRLRSVIRTRLVNRFFLGVARRSPLSIGVARGSGGTLGGSRVRRGDLWWAELIRATLDGLSAASGSSSDSRADGRCCVRAPSKRAGATQCTVRGRSTRGASCCHPCIPRNETRSLAQCGVRNRRRRSKA